MTLNQTALLFLLGAEYAQAYHETTRRWPKWVPTEGDFYTGRKWCGFTAPEESSS